MKRTKIAWKMWTFFRSNIFVVANNKRDAKKFFYDHTANAIYYLDKFALIDRGLGGEDTSRWYDYIAQGPNVWIKPDPDSDHLERFVCIKSDEAQRILHEFSDEIEKAPLKETINRALAAEVITSATSNDIPFCIRRHVVIHGRNEGHTTFTYALCYPTVTPELAADRLEVEVNDPRQSDDYADDESDSEEDEDPLDDIETASVDATV